MRKREKKKPQRLTIREKLELLKQIEQRNEQRRKAFKQKKK